MLESKIPVQSCGRVLLDHETPLVGIADGSRRLSFSEAGRTPVGSQDLGGFTNTLHWIRPVVRIRDGSDRATASAHVSRPDGDLGNYSSDSAVELSRQ